MIAATILLVIAALAFGIWINLYLRSWVATEARTEAHLRDPRTHAVAYAVPNGVDPVVVMRELSRAGFDAAIERVGDLECMRIECEADQRDEVRAVIEGAHLSAYDGTALKLGDVVFEDER